MSRILIVDDETRYRDLIGQVISSEGHETRTAASGREALDLGGRYRPDVVVTDWMLKDDIHGLHVVQVLRAILPDVRAIMMTGFPSDDLRQGAAEAGVYGFLEKPFDAGRIREAVREAAARPKSTTPALSFAMIEIDSGGSIVFANAAARSLMSELPSGRDARALASLFADDVATVLDAATDRWVAVLPRLHDRRCWHLRSQEPMGDGSRLIVLRRSDEAHYLGLALIEMLLGVRDFRRTFWPLDQRVLVIDDEPWLRALCVSLLETAGAGCYAAGTCDEALRLLEQDEDLRFVLVDFEMPGADPRSTVEKIRAVCSDATIVGTSSGGHRAEFAAIGVDRYIEKPWRVEDLISVLTGRIANCISCGLPIPLRQPEPGEAAGHWECCNCGARYRAVIDEDSPGHILSNARPAPPG
jgi:CheY-like chemotaxis protein